MADKMRVHILARELNVPSKVIITKCQAEGLKVTNHMSTLSAGLAATIREWFSDGQHDTTLETTSRVDLTKVRLADKKRKTRTRRKAASAGQAGEASQGAVAVAEKSEHAIESASRSEAAAVVADGAASSATAEKTAPAAQSRGVQSTAAESAGAQPTAGEPVGAQAAGTPAAGAQTAGAQSAGAQSAVAQSAATTVAEIARPSEPGAPGEAPGVAEQASEVAEQASEVAEQASGVPTAEVSAPESGAGVAKQERPAAAGRAAEPGAGQEVAGTAPAASAPAAATPPSAPPEPEVIVPAGPQNIPAPAQLTGPRVVRYEAPESVPPPRRSIRRRPGAVTNEAPAPPPLDIPKDSGPRGGATGRGAPYARGRRGRGGQLYRPEHDSAEQLREWRDRDLVERQERIHDATGRRIHTRRAVSSGGASHGAPVAPKTEATIQAPIIIRDLCAATGVSMLQMLPILKREFGTVGFMNMELTAEMAEYIAAEHGINLTVVPARTALDEIEEEFAARKPVDVRPRPPVVTFLGHVDHGKTSLLDVIRSAHVTDSEDGGITQHIGAYHLKHKSSGTVTFLDTPGHAAFTAMRARGAQMTDIVVLVIAADDGMMPQTIEAINHAKAAEVPVVVALNKIDLGEQNVNKIYGQLADQGLAPSGDWGGETDVIHTSATTGQGVDELIEHLVALGEVLDLRADYKGDATGTVIEAETKEGVGAVVRVLVQRGTLRTGNILVCGNAYGKVRALLNDRGQRVKEAGPSIPVEVWGLDEVPMAGDRFYAVKRMQRAKAIGEDSRRRRLHEGRGETRRIRSLEEAFKQRNREDIPELNVIIKADVDGSVDALRSMLAQIPSDEVKLSIRHAAVGAVTDSDVLLADASNAVIIAFRVLPVAGAKKLADHKGVDVRHYKVIYEVADDVRKALEGLLEPDTTLETRATCEVRSVFRISKVGPVAGCYVASGTISRNHLVRLIRDGVVVREDAKIASLRRFKEDAREVRSGLECGIRLEDFDDVKPGDVIEGYEIVKVARTL